MCLNRDAFDTHINNRHPDYQHLSLLTHQLHHYSECAVLSASSLREGHANLLCIVPILTDVAEATLCEEA